MTIFVVKTDGKECNATKDQLQYLLKAQRVWYFKRSDGWAVVGHAKMRSHETPIIENDRRTHKVYAMV